MRVVITLSLIGLVAVQTGCATAISKSKTSEENYDLLAVTTGPCAPKIGVSIEPRHEAACKQMIEPRLYRGSWYVDFETSYFTPVGGKYCWETKELGDCLELIGKALPWPRRSDCARQYYVEFIGRRNLLPHNYEGAAYRIVVDKVLSVKRRPDPPHELGECDAAAS